MVTKTERTCLCDICGSENAESYSFIYDRRLDAAGSLENWYHDVDLCGGHSAELVRKYGHPKDYGLRVVNRADAIAYGKAVKEWAEMKESIWRKMSSEERQLALAIEAL